MKKKKILLVLGRGEAIRNFVLSGTVAELRKSAEVAIISIVPNAEIGEILKKEADEFYELKDVNTNSGLNYLRDWLDIVHGRFLWSGVAKFRWKLRDHEAQSGAKRIKRNLQKTFAYPFANASGVEMVSALESSLSRKVFPSEYYVDLIRKIKPDLVFNGSHIHNKNTVPVLYAARKLHLRTATFLFSWDNLTSQGRIIPSYDDYIVWNEQIGKDLLRIYRKIKPEQVHVTGTPQFDFHFQKDKFWSREEYCRSIGADPSRPIILYTTGMLNLQPGEEAVVEGIADMLLRMPDPKPQLVVRVYPKETSGRFEPMKARRKDIIFPDIPWERKYFTPMPADLMLWTNMLYHCDAGINVASTVSLELCMFDKPTLNVVYNPPGINIYPKDYPIIYTWDHYLPLTNSGAIYLAHSEEEMETLLHEALAHPEEKSGQRKKLIKEFFGNTLDGKAYKRIAEQLLTFANQLTGESSGRN
jgi:hypothetical protein